MQSKQIKFNLDLFKFLTYLVKLFRIKRIVFYFFLVAPQRKRKCKDVYEVAWWEYPPYIYKIKMESMEYFQK